jgi:hypothetical protein
MGYLTGIGEYKNDIISLSMINGFRFSDAFFAGIGVGIGYSNEIIRVEQTRLFFIDIITVSRGSAILIPIYANIKANLTNNTKTTPFLSLNVGYTIDALVSISNAPGFMLQPSFGFDHRMSDKSSIYFSVGFNLQRFNYTFVNHNYTNINDFITRRSEMNKAVDIRMGFRF